MVTHEGFCVWVTGAHHTPGAPGAAKKVTSAIARAVATDLAHVRPVEEVGPGPDWLYDAPSEVRWHLHAHLARALSAHGVVVVLATEAPEDAWRAEMRAVVPALVEVALMEAAPMEVPPGDWAPDLTVPGDPARAGEAARAVLRHLAEAGWTEPFDDYDDDDEAAVFGRLQNFGYV